MKSMKFTSLCFGESFIGYPVTTWGTLVDLAFERMVGQIRVQSSVNSRTVKLVRVLKNQGVSSINPKQSRTPILWFTIPWLSISLELKKSSVFAARVNARKSTQNSSSKSWKSSSSELEEELPLSNILSAIKVGYLKPNSHRRKKIFVQVISPTPIVSPAGSVVVWTILLGRALYTWCARRVFES